MDTQNTKIQLLIKKIKTPSFVYSTIFFTFAIIVIVLFLLSTNFIVKNINNIFLPVNDETTQALDTNNYAIVAKRLGFSVDMATSSSPSSTKETIPPSSTTATPVKASLSVHILNSTTVTGSAAALSKQLESAGFAKAITGNQRKTEETTIIQIKESAKPYAEAIKSIVGATYPSATIADAPAEVAADITIIIGKR